MSTLPGWIRDWAATLAPPPGATAGADSWQVLLGPPAFLVPPEVLGFPHQEFRWSWTLERGPGDQYQIEGSPGAWQFRNARTGQIDPAPAFGAGAIQVAGDELGGCTCTPASATSGPKANPEQIADSDEVDPRAITWLTEEDWLNHGADLWPVWITNDYDVGKDPCPAGFDAGGVWVGCDGELGHEGAHVSGGEAWDTAEPWDPKRCAELEQLYAEHRLGRGRLMQCGATTQQWDVWTECSLCAGHPGPHMNGPPRLGRIWIGLEDDGEEVVGAVKQPIDWYRIHYVDAVTGSDAYSPWPQRMTLTSAKAWVRKRTTWGSSVIPILQRFISGLGWRTA
ncbi:MAG: hypothetical protein PHX83_14600 [Acidobacteriia bacterium]|nr:hypothetical protein [Terriglobia bacterium]